MWVVSVLAFMISIQLLHLGNTQGKGGGRDKQTQSSIWKRIVNVFSRVALDGVQIYANEKSNCADQTSEKSV